MKKKAVRCALLLAFIAVVLVAIFSTYKWIVTGEQNIKISTSKKAYTNSDLYVSFLVQEDGIDVKTESQVKLLDSNGKMVKDAEVFYEGNIARISIPDIEAGNYTIEAKVSSENGKDTVKKDIYIAKSNYENITITMDKGIYKPR